MGFVAYLLLLTSAAWDDGLCASNGLIITTQLVSETCEPDGSVTVVYSVNAIWECLAGPADEGCDLLFAVDVYESVGNVYAGGAGTWTPWTRCGAADNQSYRVTKRNLRPGRSYWFEFSLDSHHSDVTAIVSHTTRSCLQQPPPDGP